MLDKNEFYIRKYHATSNVVYRSVGSLLHTAQSSDMGTCLQQFSTCTKQLESLWNDMEPVFSLVVPVPKKPVKEGDSSKFVVLSTDNEYM